MFVWSHRLQHTVGLYACPVPGDKLQHTVGLLACPVPGVKLQHTVGLLACPVPEKGGAAKPWGCLACPVQDIQACKPWGTTCLSGFTENRGAQSLRLSGSKITASRGVPSLRLSGYTENRGAQSLRLSGLKGLKSSTVKRQVKFQRCDAKSTVKDKSSSLVEF